MTLLGVLLIGMLLAFAVVSLAQRSLLEGGWRWRGGYRRLLGIVDDVLDRARVESGGGR